MNELEELINRIIGDETIRLTVKKGEGVVIHVEGSRFGLLYLLVLAIKKVPSMLSIMQEAIEYSKQTKSN